MPCFRPLAAWRTGDGPLFFWAKDGAERLNIPCGQCSGCRLRRARHWATRCVHESQLHDLNCFLTLTYADPCPVSLRYRDFQLFMKRVRESLKVPIRYFVCGEYGESTFRPHFHACLFGVDFLDKQYWSLSKSGERLYDSKKADALWGHGKVWIGAVTFQSASYVARYIMKKVTGDLAEGYYQSVTEDGELVPVEPEFVHMSLKPGIGAGWLQKFGSDVFPSGEVVVNGKKSVAPRYYDLWYAKGDDEKLQVLKDARYKRMVERLENNSVLFAQRRLAAGEVIQNQKSNLFKRDI